MKKICFIEMEGILASHGNYVPNERRAKLFLQELLEFSKKSKIEFFLVSGHHISAAKDMHLAYKLHNFFDENHFVFVDEEYINSKAEMDKELHRANLAKDRFFVDSYFKQIAIQRILKEKKILQKDAFLLSNDIWAGGYYTMRFSKIDYAIFEENVLDRGKPVERISGLAYFNLDFDSVKRLIEHFPRTDNSALDKYVFESMKKALVGDKFVDAVKKGLTGLSRNK